MMNLLIIVSVFLAILVWVVAKEVHSYFYDTVTDAQFRLLQVMLHEYPSLANELKQFESSGDVTRREYDIIRRKYKQHEKDQAEQRKKARRSNRISAYLSRLKVDKRK